MRFRQFIEFLITCSLLQWSTYGLGSDELMLYGNFVTGVEIREIDGRPCKFNDAVNGDNSCKQTARLSLDLRADEGFESMKSPSVRVEDVYFVLFNFPFSELLQDSSQHTLERHLGIILAPGKPQMLQYDAKKNKLDGILNVMIATPLTSEDMPTTHLPEEVRGYQFGTLHLRIWLSSSTFPLKTYDDASFTGWIEADLEIGKAAPNQEKILWIQHFREILWLTKVIFNLAKLDKVVSMRNLCLQPVGIRLSEDDTDETGLNGATLAFGLPTAIDLWGRLGQLRKPIRFSVRNPVIKEAPDLKTLSFGQSSRYTQLYDASDCVEIFLVKNPTCLYGGGLTWNRGNNNAFVILTDQTILAGSLAHELGHVMGFPDAPDSSGSVSTNTIMCTKGDCATDNPRRNSKFNIDNASNSLFTIGITTVPGGAHCDHGDCGACP